MDRSSVSVVVGCIPLAICAPNLSATVVLDGSFEAANVITGSYVYNPSDTPWTFLSYSGVLDGSGGAWGAPPPVDGSQAAWLQYYHGNAGVIQQAVSFPTAGQYELRYWEAGRPSSGHSGELTYEVRLDSVTIATSSTYSAQPYLLRTFTFSADAGPHVLSFAAAAHPNTDDSAFLDDISITLVPEPASLLLLAAGGLVILRRRIPARPSACCAWG
ncbi:MAG: hypothetical protein AMXMBFR13_05800 [Phycisphaerae bacterium]